MVVNRRIIVATLLIMATGVYTVLAIEPATGSGKHTTLTRVIVGAYMLAIIVSVLDLVSPNIAGALGGGLLMVALLTALYAVLPNVFSKVNSNSSIISRKFPGLQQG